MVILINYCFKEISECICEDIDFEFAKTTYTGLIRPDKVLYFDDENCKINDHSEMGYIFTCQFNNGKAKLSDYESILKDLIKTYDSSISDDIISSGMENGRNNNLKTVNITDKVTIEYNYASEPISIRSGDSYIIEMILGK